MDHRLPCYCRCPRIGCFYSFSNSSGCSCLLNCLDDTMFFRVWILYTVAYDNCTPCKMMVVCEMVSCFFPSLLYGNILCFKPVCDHLWPLVLTPDSIILTFYRKDFAQMVLRICWKNWHVQCKGKAKIRLFITLYTVCIIYIYIYCEWDVGYGMNTLPCKIALNHSLPKVACMCPFGSRRCQFRRKGSNAETAVRSSSLVREINNLL